MYKNAFILRKNIKNDTIHLFPAETIDEDSCKAVHTSICGEMTMDDKGETLFSCQPEESARKQCAKIGKKVCGKCVSFLYDNGL